LPKLENHPKLKQAEELSMADEATADFAQLQTNHPDFIRDHPR
jgi:hypothetical protein